MESSNNIIHPTRPKGLGIGRRCFGRVMMSVSQPLFDTLSRSCINHGVTFDVRNHD
jgi:hypothetical protein